MIKLKLFLLVLLFLSFSVEKLRAQDLYINGTNFDGFGRIEFRWQRQVPYEIKVFDREIFITFSRIVDTSPDILKEKLPNYISEIYLSSDLRTIIIKLLGDFKVKDFSKNGVIYVDIIGQGVYDINQILKNITPTDKKSLTGSLLLVPKADPRLVRPKKEEPLATIVTPKTKEENKPKPVQKVQPKKKESLEKVNLRIGKHDDYQRIVFEWEKPISYALNEKNGELEIRFNRKGKVVNPDIVKSFPEELSGLDFELKGNSLYARIPMEKDSSFKDMTLGNRAVIDIYNVDKTKKENIKPVKEEVKKTESPVIKKEEKSAPQKPAPAVEKVVTKEIITPLETSGEIKASINKSEVKRTGEKIATIALPLGQKRKMAIFNRHGIWWMVFDGDLDIKFDVIKDTAKEIVKEIAASSNKEYTIIRMLVEGEKGLKARQDGTTWLIDIYSDYVNPENNIEIISQAGIYSGAKMYLPVRDASKPITITDPEVGDILNIICLPTAGYGISENKYYPDFELNRTIQGIVIAPRVSDLNINVNDFGAEIMRKDIGLSLSSTQVDLEEAKGVEEKETENKMSVLKLFDIVDMQTDKPEDYYKKLYEIKKEIYELPKESRNRARLKLARFYLANNMIPEAFGVLEVVELHDPEIKENAMFATLIGATEAMLKRYDDALGSFKIKALDNNKEAALWNAYIHVMKDDSKDVMEDYYKDFKSNVNILRDYPTAIRNKIAIQGLKVAVAMADENMANDYISVITSNDVKGLQMSALLFYKGLMSALSGYFEQAFTLFDEAMNSDSMYYRALASREKLKLEFKLNRKTHKEVLKELEKLRYSWRGDKFEYDVMNDLVNIYLENKSYNEALSALKDMTDIFQNPEHNKSVKERMEKIFEDLYLKGDADALSPVKAIGIYNDFKEITPAGEKGNEMIRRLADRMVSVDLLEQASELLKNQIDHRLSGQEKVIVGARLSLIDIMNNQPEAAIKALDSTESQNASNTLKGQRRLIRAKAMSEMGQKDEAINLIKNDNTDEARLLKTEILWSAKKWDDVADILRSMIKKPKVNEKISDEQAGIIIDWATALRLAGKEKVLLRVRDNFGPYMAKTKLNDTFNLLTDVSDTNTFYNKFSEQIKSAEGFKKFMNSYVSKMKDSGLSETIK